MMAARHLCLLLVCLMAALGRTPANASHFTTLKGPASHLRALKQGGPTTLEGSGTESADNIAVNNDLGDQQTGQLSLGSGLTANSQQGRGVGSSIGRRLHQAADPTSMYKYAQRLLWGSVAGSGTGAGDSGAGGSKQKSELGSSMQQQGVHHLVGRRCGLVGCASASTATGTDAAATGTASVSSDLVRSLRALLQGDSSLPGGMSDTATGPASSSRSRRTDDEQAGSSLATVVVAPGGLQGGRRLRQL